MVTGRRIANNILKYFTLTLIGVFFLFPFYWLIISALKDNAEIFSRNMTWIPEVFRWENFVKGWIAIPPYSYNIFFKNTFILVITNIAFNVFSSTLVAYGFARIKFKFRNTLFIIMLSTMMLPSQVMMIPRYLLWTRLHSIDTYFPLIIPSLFGTAFFIFLLRQFMATIPYEMDEAAICDGCSKIVIFLKIILPLCKPAVFTVLLFAFQDYYESFFDPLIYLNSITKYPISLALRLFVTNEGRTEWGIVLAMVLICMIPQIVVFACSQKSLVKGISTSGLKM